MELVVAILAVFLGLLIVWVFRRMKALFGKHKESSGPS